MAAEPRGLYRTMGESGTSNWARVTDGDKEFDIPEVGYRDRGFQPEFDDLPLKADYEAAQR